jgi:hypothetical protein
VNALRAKLARLMSLIRQHGLRSGIAHILAARKSPLFGLNAPSVDLAHVTRMDRSSARLVVHGRCPSGVTQLQGSAVVHRHLAAFPLDVHCAEGAFELEVPLQAASRFSGPCDMKFVVSDGSKHWILGRKPQRELFNQGAVTVPVSVVALPESRFIRLRVRPHPEGELRVVTESMPGVGRR